MKNAAERIKVVEGDITRQPVEAIVNAAKTAQSTARLDQSC